MIKIILLARFVKHQQISCWTLPINSNNHTYLVSQCFMPEHSVQIKNIFLLYSITRVTHRNAVLNDSDDRHFVLQTFSLSMVLCFFVCSSCDVSKYWHWPLEIFYQKHFKYYFYHEIMLQNIINNILIIQ